MVIILKIKDIIKATHGKNYNINLNDTYNKIKTNSKKVCINDIFIALTGSKSDGHDYITEAINNGAKLIISSKKLSKNIPYILVNNTEKSLGDIASYMLDKYKPLVIAVTGSVGKTTTRDLLYNILKNKYNVIGSEKNYNNNIGVPLTIFNINNKTDILILEMGMNHLKEISHLSCMVKPDISIITNIGSSHIGYLKSKEIILMAKLEILDGMDKKILFINGDDDYLKNINGNTFKSGFKCNNNLTAYGLKSNLYSSSFKIKYKGKEYIINIDLPKHLLENVLIAINVSLYLNIDINTIISSLNEYKSFDKRMNIIHDNNNNTIINDCYNSSFESLTGVLSLLEKEDSNKLLILGSIKELGDKSKEIHEKLKPFIDKINNKKVLLVGDEMKSLKIDALYFNDYQDTINYLKSKKIKDTLILIKASRSLKFENITNYFIN